MAGTLFWFCSCFLVVPRLICLLLLASPLTGVCPRNKKKSSYMVVLCLGTNLLSRRRNRGRGFGFSSLDLNVLTCCSNMVAEGKIPLLIVGFLLPFVSLSTQEFMSSLDFSAAVWKLIDCKPPLYSSFTHCTYSCKERVCHFQI